MSSSSVAMPRSRSSGRKRRLDPPAAAHRQLLTGTRLEQAGEDPARTVAYLHAGCSSVREAMRRAILSGGSTAQASPASRTARGMPQTAQLASSWARIDPPQATRRDAPSTPSRPMPVSTTPSAPAAEYRADRGEHRVDRGHAAAACPAMGQPDDAPCFEPVRASDAHRLAQRGSGRAQLPCHPRQRAPRGARRAPSWRAKTRHERDRQMLGDEDRDADLGRQAHGTATPSAWMPPVEAPIARTSIGSVGIARSRLGRPPSLAVGRGRAQPTHNQAP